MDPNEIEKIELELFLEAIYQRCRYDFRHYAKASVRRRVRHLLAASSCTHIADLISLVLYDEHFAQRAVDSFSITVSEMFRDPDFFSAVRRTIVPYLRTYPFFKVWVAGCATGEEVYSIAILLAEEGLVDRATIFATDFNSNALKKAQEGIYPLKEVQQYTANYQKAGGQSSFSDYYHAQYDSAIMSHSLKANISFSNHNLVENGVFNELQLIFCRNVLIYFDRTLQNWVFTNLANSLSRGGFLCLGAKESLEFSSVSEQFKAVEPVHRIYQKRAK